MSDHIYVTIDANDVGKRIEKFILGDNLKELSLFSERITSRVLLMKNRIIEGGGEIYMAGGDNIIALVKTEKLKELAEVVRRLNDEEINFSIGVSEAIAEAYLALKYAKANGVFMIKYTKGFFCEINSDE